MLQRFSHYARKSFVYSVNCRYHLHYKIFDMKNGGTKKCPVMSDWLLGITLISDGG